MGARLEDGVEWRSGAAYIFDRDAGDAAAPGGEVRRLNSEPTGNTLVAQK